MDEMRERNLTRRDFAVGTAGAAAMLGLGGMKYLPEASLCRPPGGQDELGLIGSCVHCEKCREICPQGAITTTHIESGLLNARTPHMGFRRGWCDFCENKPGGPRCIEVCPTHALSSAKPQDFVIGKAQINTDWCLAFRGLGCHECVDACPYGAMKLRPDGMPEVLADVCNGCGRCENVCISLSAGSLQGATDRAIVVRPL